MSKSINVFIYHLIFDYIMKHIGMCLDKIQIVMAHIPRTVISPEDKERASDVLDDVQEYTNTLNKLILHPKFKKNLRQLEKSSIEGVRLQAHEIEKLFNDLEHMLYVLDLTLTELREIIALKHDEDEIIKRWKRAYDKIVIMIYQKFNDERSELNKEFQIVLYEKKVLRELAINEKHLAYFLE